MMKNKNKNLSIIILIIDLILLLIAFFTSKQIILITQNLNISFYDRLMLPCLLLWSIIGFKKGLYDIPRIIQIHKVISRYFKSILIFGVISAALIFIGTDSKFSRVFFIVVLLVFTFFITIWRLIIVYWLKYTRRKGNKSSKLMIVGMNSNVARLISKVYVNKSFGFSILGIFTNAQINDDIKKYYKGRLSDVFDSLNENQVDEIIISLPYSQSKLINDLFQYADNNMIRVRVIPEFSEYLSQVFTISYLQNIPIMKLRKEPLQSLSNRVIKRVFDIVFSLGIVLFLFSWLFPIIALIIKLTSKGPVFFSQLRTGKDGESFKCFKFRSMEVNIDSDSKQATKDDKRITPFGAFMRKTSIDELPQIINVLLNNMSLVGPRPHMLKHTEEYRVLVDKFMVRHFAKPGVTGWAQINGFRGETKLVKDMANRAEADIWYIENWSFFLDLKIIFLTTWSMFFKRDENAF